MLPLAQRLPYPVLLELFERTRITPQSVESRPGRALIGWDSNAVLAICSVVCQSWLDPARDVLYSSACISTSAAATSFLETSAARPDLVAKIRHLSIGLGEDGGGTDPEHESLKVVRVLEACVSLCHLEVRPLEMEVLPRLFEAIMSRGALLSLVLSPRMFPPGVGWTTKATVKPEVDGLLDVIAGLDLRVWKAPEHLHPPRSLETPRNCRLHSLRLDFELPPEFLFVLLDSSSSTLQVADLYFERILDGARARAAMRQAGRQLRKLRWISNPTIDELAKLDAAHMPLFDDLLPGLHCLEQLSVSAIDISTTSLRNLPLTLKDLSVSSFNSRSAFVCSRELVDILRDATVRFALETLTVYDMQECWPEPDLEDVRRAALSRGISFTFHPDPEPAGDSESMQNSASPLATLPIMDHAVPFGQTVGPAPSLSYGFGMSPSTAFGVASAPGWGAAPGSTGSPGWRSPAAWGTAGSSSRMVTPVRTVEAVLAGSGSRRRQRSEMPPSDDEPEAEREILELGIGVGRSRGKRARVGGDDARQGAAAAGREAIDIGKSLASLSKDSLLTLLTSLITANPALRPLVAALLPPPTLATTFATLVALERNVLQALPSGVTVREDYVWGRVRVPLEEYVAEAKTFLTAFCSPTAAGPMGSIAPGEDAIGHPSTTFAFLYALTSSLRRIEAQLPSPPNLVQSPNFPLQRRNAQDLLSTQLLPSLINHWHLFITRLSTAVNQQGRILSAGVLRGWFLRLDELAVESPGVVDGSRGEGGARRACEGVRDRLKRDLGWLVGINAESVGSARVDMEEEEEL